MAKDFGSRLADQLQQSPLVKETDNYMENQVLNPEAPSVIVGVGDEKPQATNAVKRMSPKKQVSSSDKYPAPFVNEIQPSAPKHCQALVDSKTYANMNMLKVTGAVPPNMSFGAMATEALKDWVDRKIREFVAE